MIKPFFLKLAVSLIIIFFAVTGFPPLGFSQTNIKNINQLPVDNPYYNFFLGNSALNQKITISRPEIIPFSPAEIIFPIKNQDSSFKSELTNTSQKQSDFSDNLIFGNEYSFDFQNEGYDFLVHLSVPDIFKYRVDINFELTYPDGKKEIYYNLFSFPILDVYRGAYRVKVNYAKKIEDSTPTPSYNLTIQLVRKYYNYGNYLILPQNKYLFTSEEISELLKKGDKFFVISSQNFIKALGLNLSSATFPQEPENIKKDDQQIGNIKPDNPSLEDRIFAQLSTAETVDAFNIPPEKKNDIIPIIKIKDQVLALKYLFPVKINGQTAYREVFLLSQDLFRLNESLLTAVLLKFFPEQIAGISTSFTPQKGLLSSLGGIAKTASFLFLGLILYILIWTIISGWRKGESIGKRLLAFFDFIRNIINRYFFPILAGLIILMFFCGAILFIIGSNFYRWYTTSSGMDLIPDLTIQDILLASGVSSITEFILIFTAPLFLLLVLFLFWLKPLSYLFLKEKIIRLFVLINNILSIKLKTALILVFAFLSVIFLYSLFFLSPKLSLPLFYLLIITVLILLFLIFHTDYKNIEISPRSKLIINLLFLLIIFQPLLYSVYQIYQKHPLSYQKEFTLNAGDPNALNTQNQLYLSSSATSQNQFQNIQLSKESAESIISLIRNLSKAYSQLNTAEPLKAEVISEQDKNYRRVSEFPFFLHLKPNLSFALSKLDALKLKIKFKTNSALFLGSSLLYEPSLENFSHLLTTQNYDLYAKKELINQETNKFKSDNLNDIILNNISRNSTIAVKANNPRFTGPIYEDLYLDKFITKDIKIENPNEYREYFTNLRGGDYVFYTYLENKLDFNIFARNLNLIPGEDFFNLFLLNSQDQLIKYQSFIIPPKRLGEEGNLETIKFTEENLTSGIYKIIFHHQNQQNKQDYLIEKIGINSPKLILRPQKTLNLFGGNKLYFKNFSNNLFLASSFQDQFNSINICNDKNECRLIYPSPDNEIFHQDLNKEGLSSLETTNNIEKSISNSFYSNLYSFTPESFFYPFDYYFTDMTNSSDYLISTQKVNILKKGDWVTAELTLDPGNSINSANSFTFPFNVKSDSFPSFILDNISLTLIKK